GTRDEDTDKETGEAAHAIGGPGEENQFADPLGGAHDAGGIHGFIGGDEDEAFATGVGGGVQKVEQAKHIVADGLVHVGLHDGDMLVGSGVEDNLNAVFDEQPAHTVGVGDVGDTIGDAGASGVL